VAPVLSFVAAATCLLFVPLADDVGFDRYHLPKELCLTAGAAIAATVAWRRRFALDAVNGALFSLLLLAVAASLLATTPLLAVRSLSLTLVAGALFVLARTCDDAEARQVRLAVVAAGVAVAAVALLETFGAVTGLSGTGRAPGSTLGQRNSVAHLALVVSPIAWTLAAKASSRRERLMLLLGAAVLAGAIGVTRSRAAWVAAPVVALVWALCARRWVPLAVAAIAAVTVSLIQPQLFWTSDQPYRDTAARLIDVSGGSGLGRLTQYRATLGLIAAHPLLGAGPGNWAVEYPTVAPPDDPTFDAGKWLPTGRMINSDWLALASEYGLLALMTAAALAASISRRRGAVPTLIALSGLGALDGVLQLPAQVACAALLLGVATRTRSARMVPRWVGAALIALLLIASVLAAMRVAGFLARLQGGFAGPETALRWNPADVQTRSVLAEAYMLEDGHCDRARPHVKVLSRQLPHHPVVSSIAAACRTR